MSKRFLQICIIFFAGLYLGYRINRIYYFGQLQEAAMNMFVFRSEVNAFLDYLQNHRHHQTDEQHNQSCKKFYTYTQDMYKKNEENQLAFCYLLYLTPGICDSVEKFETITEVFNQAYEKFNILEKLNKDHPVAKFFWS